MGEIGFGKMNTSLKEWDETHVPAKGHGQDIPWKRLTLAAVAEVPSECLPFPVPPQTHLAALNGRLFLESTEYKLWGFP